ncbi:unnamed protein product [Effrenium voratum]|uniref:Uncharacterized protein n=1 Tax=Effrenium voratum TaxID=2562239 RepID=A0AA36N7C1_9DINO|nr:unnamed protein product [Effrenium voratum]
MIIYLDTPRASKKSPTQLWPKGASPKAASDTSMKAIWSEHRIYVLGGVTELGELKDFYYDPQANHWQEMSPTAPIWGFFSATATPSGTYIHTGQSMYLSLPSKRRTAASSSTSVSTTSASPASTSTLDAVRQAAAELAEGMGWASEASSNDGAAAKLQGSASLVQNGGVAALLPAGLGGGNSMGIMGMGQTSVVVTVTVLSNSSTLTGGQTSEGRTRLVADAVDVSLFQVSRGIATHLSVEDVEPIYLRLAQVEPKDTFHCAFLDGDVWRSEGVHLANATEVADYFRANGVEMEPTGVWCATTHLSIFGVLEELLDCTNLHVLSPDGLAQIGDSEWRLRTPAMSFWLLLAFLLKLVFFGIAQDAKFARDKLWHDELFLTELSPVRTRCWPGCGSRHAAAQQARAVRPLHQKLQEALLCQNTLRAAARQHRIHSSTIEAHIWGRRGWVQGSLAQKSPSLKKLTLEMEKTLPWAFEATCSSRCFRCWSTCLAVHPVLELLHWDLHVSAAKRAKLALDSVLGALAFVALFFTWEGSAVVFQGDACPVEQGSILWYVFVSCSAILLNALPCSCMHSLARRQFAREWPDRSWQLKVRSCWDFGFWALGMCLTTCHVMMILAILANLQVEHEWKWMISLAVVLARKLILVPFLACVLSLVPDLLPDDGQVSKKFGLDMQLQSDTAGPRGRWHEKVEELAGRGISVRQLLDFYSHLGQDVMPHFDPARSTTHDVVRQAIIPLSLRLRHCCAFEILPEDAPGLVCSVFGADGGSKPWKVDTACRAKGSGQVWVVEDLFQEEGLLFRLGSCSAHLSSSEFWNGFKGELRLGDDESVALCIVRRSTASLAACSTQVSTLQGEAVQINLDMEELSPKTVSLPYSSHIGDASRDKFERGSTGFAYSTVVNPEPQLATRMVTHNWTNSFVFLLAAIFADALHLETYEHIAQLLAKRRLDQLAERLKRAKRLGAPYWVCAFSVNQHAGICSRPPAADSTGIPIAACTCDTLKHFDGDLSEMNKFDDMMAYLKRELREVSNRTQEGVRLQQVVAMDVDFTLLTRVWCIGELAEGKQLHLIQAIKVHSSTSQHACLDQILQLDVAKAQASYPADKELVLSKIDDTQAFNKGLQNLLLHRLDNFLGRSVAPNCLDDVLLAALTVI